MLFSATFTMAIVYLMLLCDNIIAGLFLGTDGVAAINLVAPLIGITTFLSLCISSGMSIMYGRAIGAADRKRADQIYSLGVIATAVIAVIIPLMLIVLKETYFRMSGAQGTILNLAREYYWLLPLDAFLTIICTYIEQAVFFDGDEQLETLSYVAQIGGNIVLSIFLAKWIGIRGIMLGTVIGNALALVILSLHYLKKSNTLRFIKYFSWKDLGECIKYSIVDAITYPLWGIMDFVLITYITRFYDEKYLVVLAVVFSLIELAVIFDGIGAAIEPLISVYFGEKNHLMVRRLVKTAVKSAVIEGIIATGIIIAFAPWFARLFGINSTDLIMRDAVIAIRIVAATFVFSALFMLGTSYFLYTDHILFSVFIIVLKDGMLCILLSILCSRLFGVKGLWLGFALAPVAGLLLSMLLLRLRVGKKNFPWLLGDMNKEIEVFDRRLSPTVGAEMAETIENLLLSHGYTQKTAIRAGLFAEEITGVLCERNMQKKQNKVLVEYSTLFEKDNVCLIIRDSGTIFDITDPDLEIKGLSSFVLNALLNAQKDKDYIPTTGYNRNIIRLRFRLEEGDKQS